MTRLCRPLGWLLLIGVVCAQQTSYSSNGNNGNTGNNNGNNGNNNGNNGNNNGNTGQCVMHGTSLNGVCDNAKVQSMAAYREDDTVADGVLTTNQGVPIADDQNSLKAGPRGSTLLEDFIMREKITHFDHERIPERVVHARGAAAHGYFQVYRSLANITRAAFLQDPTKQTPVFVRFSTVGGNRGSADTVRDIRGFATKFYTDEGNFDIVGNNAPVFFIQDAIKFPDFVHSVKPEPQNEIPQASSAHDSLWDFVGQQSETMHAIFWLMSDRALPRAYANMEGFGVHTFRLVTADGTSRFVKFHWKPKLGLHSLLFDEAAKINGKDPDFNRRQLWNDIEAGNFPEWELGLQVIEEADQNKFGFDLLDPTKLVPEELVPVMRVGRMVLNRNPDNYFAETEQVAFDIGNVVPGIDFTEDPLMQGRIFSYLDTQLSRLGGVNFNEIPINRPVCPFRNNQRDGFHRETINVGRTNYDVNTVNKGVPAQSPSRGYKTYPTLVSGTKIRVRSPTFDDHFSQCTLFYQSLTKPEQDHIASAFSFELSKVTYQSIRDAVVQNLENVDAGLAATVAHNLNMALPPKNTADFPKTVSPSPVLSEILNTVNDTIRTRVVAVLVADGVNGDAVAAMKAALVAGGAYVKILSSRLGSVAVAAGSAAVVADGTLANTPSIVVDAVYVPDGGDAAALEKQGSYVQYLYETYAYLKPLAAAGSGKTLLASLGLVPASDSQAPPDGVLITSASMPGADFNQQFITNIGFHRFWNRADVDQIPN